MQNIQLNLTPHQKRRKKGGLPSLCHLAACGIGAALLLFLYTAAAASAQGSSPLAQSGQITSTLPTSGVLTTAGTITATATVTISTGMAQATSTPGSTWIAGWLPSDPNETKKIVLTAILTLLGTLAVVFFKKSPQPPGLPLTGCGDISGLSGQSKLTTAKN